MSYTRIRVLNKELEVAEWDKLNTDVAHVYIADGWLPVADGGPSHVGGFGQTKDVVMFLRIELNCV